MVLRIEKYTSKTVRSNSSMDFIGMLFVYEIKKVLFLKIRIWINLYFTNLLHVHSGELSVQYYNFVLKYA